MDKTKLLKHLPIILLCLPVMASCGNPDKDIVIVYTNDVHCVIDKNIGYAGLASYVKQVKENNEYVTLVDNGDFLQGNTIGALSKGKYLVDLMNACKYDLATFGNNDFVYGMDYLIDDLKSANFKMVCSNLTYEGDKQDNLSKYYSPYQIINYGNKKVGYIGITTPLSYILSKKEIFMEGDKLVYKFIGMEDEQEYMNNIQSTVDLVKSQGANYVVALSHLGDYAENDTYYKYSSNYLAKHTTGIDIILDGHTHSVIESKKVTNKDGNDVYISQAGTALEYIGQVTISTNGTFNFKLTKDYTAKDAEVENKVNQINDDVNSKLLVKVGHTDYDLKIEDSNNVRIVRNRECNMGDFICDSYRNAYKSDIAISPGSGIRKSIPAGDITYKDILDVNPYNNYLSEAKLSGQDILDMMEYFVKDVAKDYYKKDDQGKFVPVGENPNFEQVSGLKFTIDTSIHTPVVGNETFEYIKEGEERRIKNMQVLVNGQYVDIDKDAYYTVCSSDYLINGGAGLSKFMVGKVVTIKGAELDYESIINYLAENPDLSKYSTVDDRISVI